jgi:hypothetical protein
LSKISELAPILGEIVCQNEDAPVPLCVEFPPEIYFHITKAYLKTIEKKMLQGKRKEGRGRGRGRESRRRKR